MEKTHNIEKRSSGIVRLNKKKKEFIENIQSVQNDPLRQENHQSNQSLLSLQNILCFQEHHLKRKQKELTKSIPILF